MQREGSRWVGKKEAEMQRSFDWEDQWKFSGNRETNILKCQGSI